ncbi:MAG: hypothetical protein CMJ06_05290 [Pelagibacterales bacterium]|nr:hypothetical protein [Pelagibacterales bacterium]OUU61576.1 MAG: hypothetical protein CBC22_07355 [Alphaproteobacteria bacterium TMED62]|tara:strand:+ start:10983 stop:12227 length:1245 start_codon:yes stop_codon:yes gene_type:complete
MPELYLIIQILIIFFLIILSGFFSSSETAITSISEPLIQKKVSEEDKKAIKTQKLLKKKELIISAILLGNNLVNILSSALATNILIHSFGPIGILYSTLVMTSLIFIFAEVLPKIYAIRKPETLLIFYTPLLIFFVWLLSPINFLIQKLIHFLLSFKKIKSNTINVDRIRGAILLAAKEGEMVKDNRFMLESILDLKDREINEVMIHRKDIFSVNINEKKSFFIKLANETPFSRFPVWQNNSENIIGVIYVKDLLRALLLKNFNIKKVLQEPWFIPETTSLLGQLNAFREKQKQIAFVVDEYGVLEGLVTLEDILEEIVGQIEDEHDYPSSNLLYDNNGNIYVNGNVTIRDLNRKFNFKLPENSASTIAGLIINTAKRIPEKGENFVIQNLIINIISRNQTRITKILIKKKIKP